MIELSVGRQGRKDANGRCIIWIQLLCSVWHLSEGPDMRLCRDYSLDRLPTFDRMSVRSHPTGTKVLSTKNADPLPASITQQEHLAVHLVEFYPGSS